MNIDYNLLNNLIVISKSATLKVAAARLDRSEGSISKDLTKLREQLGDPLLVRIGSKNELTPYLRELLPKLENYFAEIETALYPAEYSPAEYQGKIKVMINSHLCGLYGDKIYSNLRSAFPKAKLYIKNWGESTERALLNEEVDIGLHLFNIDRSQSIRQIPVKNLKLAVITSNEYPISSVSDINNRPFILSNVYGWNEDKKFFINALLSSGITLSSQLEVDDFIAAKKIVKNSDFFMLMPAELIDTNDGLLTFILPDDVVNLNLKICVNIKSNFLESNIKKHIVATIKNIFD
ncbi:LysR family transcriptional regulator [Shewanella psychrotolerans]|uniref:LysR family transcriptional regulator n=1 Tax=Shewanella psychrotolerans TaxID=2864206 RepID=UPI001C658849|nr:LysR family transcriptional regulator [Shewanella psychrotolerans]QYK00402.1 LysR family transcriptional regulator [Shewanella psychrotolerans]